MRKRVLPLLPLLLAAPVPAGAQIEVGVSPYVGLHFHDNGAIAAVRGEGSPDAAVRVDASRFLGARVRVRFLGRLSAVGDIGVASLDGEVDGVRDVERAEVDGRLTLYSVGLGLDLSPRESRWGFDTSLRVGGATTDFDLREAESFSDVIVTAGLGASYRLVPHVRLRGDVGGVVQFCDRPEEETFVGCVEDGSLKHVEVTAGVEFNP